MEQECGGGMEEEAGWRRECGELKVGGG